AEVSTADNAGYLERRRGETLLRCGKWTKVPVSDGCIRLEMSIFRHMLNVARRLGYEVASPSFDMIPAGGHRTRVLKDSERERLLPECPVWLVQLLVVALETCISLGDLLRLTWSMIDYESGVIVPAGGRKKTGVAQISPLTPTVRKILDEIRAENRRSKVTNIGDLVFTREDGSSISASMVEKQLARSCALAGGKNFRFHDTRHTTKTAWASRGIWGEAAMAAGGRSPVQVRQPH